MNKGLAGDMYLVVGLQNSLYAIDVLAVREIFSLPELTPMEESPNYFIGVVNLRGNVVPVMDLAVRFGRAPQPYRSADSVIALGRDESLIGILVNEVLEVRQIPEELVDPPPAYGLCSEARFLAGVAKSDENLVMVLHLDNLLRLTEGSEGLAAVAEVSVTTGGRVFCPEATPEERAVFQERAKSLRPQVDREEFEGLKPLAVVGLNGEHFGIELHLVREFGDIRNVAPVPCCPPHVLGQMTLRGNIVTLMDIRLALKMPLNHSTPAGEVAVVQLEDLVVGVAVDSVFDVHYLNPSEIMTVPAAVRSSGSEYLQGTAPYGDRMLSILDLPRILTEGDLVVDDEI